jgi:hypothetical protein
MDEKELARLMKEELIRSNGFILLSIIDEISDLEREIDRKRGTTKTMRIEYGRCVGRK